MIDDWKGKAAGYLEDVGKKKDELIEKAATLKMEHDENQRKKIEDWVYKKEAELKELEQTLKFEFNCVENILDLCYLPKL